MSARNQNSIHWKRVAVILVCLSVTGIAAMFVWVRSSWPETYGGFRKRDISYYNDLADACEQLRSRLPASITNIPSDLIPYGGGTSDEIRDLQWQFHKRKINGDDQSLPLLIRAMKADYVEFNSDRVFISFGVGRMAWAIIWAQHFDDDSLWELETNGDGYRQTVFSRKKSPALKR